MRRVISTAPEPTRERDEIVDDIVRELGGARGESLILPEAAVRAEIMRSVSRMTAGARRWSREQRKAEADHAQSIDDLLAELELKLADPLAPRFNKQIFSAMGRLTAVIREMCQKQTLFRPKGGREVDQLKRDCASSAFHLMQKFSRHKISGSAQTSYPVIAALLFEAVTGEREANVKRACEHVLRRRRD
jgi:hypothetical protein